MNTADPWGTSHPHKTVGKWESWKVEESTRVTFQPSNFSTFPVEWQLYDPGVLQPTSNLHLQWGAGGSRGPLDIPHADALEDPRSEGAAGRLPDAPAVRAQRVSVAGDGTPPHLKSYKFPGHTARFLGQQGLPADERPLVELYRPAQWSLKRRRRLINIIPVEHVPRFQPQGVPRGQTRRSKAVRTAGLYQRAPQRRGRVPRTGDLKSIFSSVPGAGDQAPQPRHLQPIGEMKGRQPCEIGAGEPLQD